MIAWEPYKGDARCDLCHLSATQALVRMHKSGVYAESLLLAACDEHQPELARRGLRYAYQGRGGAA